jgi:hypothetical protein
LGIRSVLLIMSEPDTRKSSGDRVPCDTEQLASELNWSTLETYVRSNSSVI